MQNVLKAQRKQTPKGMKKPTGEKQEEGGTNRCLSFSEFPWTDLYTEGYNFDLLGF